MPETTVLTATDILTAIVLRLVSHPERMSIETTQDEGSASITVLVAREDIDAVLGADGRTGRSLERIVTTFAKRSGFPISFTIEAEGR